MEQEQIDSQVLLYILSQFNVDVITDGLKITEKLFKSLDLNSQEKPTNIKFLAGIIKILLNSQENLELKINPTSSLISVLVKNVKEIVQCNEEKCYLSNTEIQNGVLSIIESIFNAGIKQNFEELTELYIHILNSINDALDFTKNPSHCLKFKLKILTSIYKILASNSVKLSVRSKEECEIFTTLILLEKDDIGKETLLYLIPAYVSCSKNCEVIKAVWEKISNLMSFSNNSPLDRYLIILCNFFFICLDQSLWNDKITFLNLFLNDANYWKLVQLALVDNDGAKRKQGMYLLKKTFEILNDANFNVPLNKENQIFYWEREHRDTLLRIYNELILCLEFLEEQQAHIVKPVFKMVETLMDDIINLDKVNFSWVLLLCKKALLHENIQIAKWGLNILFKLPEKFFSCKQITRETVSLLVNTLNHTSLYYNDGLQISKDLRVFLKKFAQLPNSKLFFSLFIKQICSLVWSCEALYFVTYSLSGIGKFSFWGIEEVTELKYFISKAFKTYNKIIKSAIEFNLVNAVLSLIDKNIPLENIISLVSSFSTKAVMKFGSPTWNILISFFKSSYSTKEMESFLEKCKNFKMGEEFNEKCVSIFLVLFYYSHEYKSKQSIVMNYFEKVLYSFNEICKRAYCKKLSYDHNLSIISHIYKFSEKSTSEFIELSLPYIDHLVLYIQSQLLNISSLQELSLSEIYLTAFETIVINFFETNNFRDLCNYVVNNLISHSNFNVSSVGLYLRIKVFYIVKKYYQFGVQPSYLESCIIHNVNKPLEKDVEDSDNTRDLQVLWGKMNSEFLETKWKILEYIINNKLVPKSGDLWISNEELTKLCMEALNTGGYGVLCPVMSILKNLLPTLEDEIYVKRITELIWCLIMERRKTDEFKLYTKKFFEMIFQEFFAAKGEDILIKYVDLIFSDSSLTVVNIFMKHFQQMDVLKMSIPLFCHVIGKALIFGPIPKRNEKLTVIVCSHINSLNVSNFESKGDCNPGAEIRARAVERLLELYKSSPRLIAVQNLYKTLLKLEKEINKDRIRYFNDSHVHRVKHRLMQALLLLEPILCSNKEQSEQLSNWLFTCLMTETSQPSVRFQQEWLLIKASLRHPSISSTFCLSGSDKSNMKISKKGICSLLAVTFHICKQYPDNLREERIDLEMPLILSYCFHQHFEVRLYAQVVFQELYKISTDANFKKIVEKYESTYNSLVKSFYRDLKENSSKLIQDFFFIKFHPLKHYSLESIYTDVPKLTNVSSDEWISTKTLKNCGINTMDNDIVIPIENPDGFLINSDEFKLFSASMTEPEAEGNEDLLVNYQKKIIPTKPLIPGWEINEENTNLKKEGLIVVASLIDRVPNLGGLARTCEIFGASEYIVNSLRYLEDKQFTSLSVTAEKWITVKEVKVQNLFNYVAQMKNFGYTVIGAEQALHSQPLNSVKLPKKTLLLLGNEKEGIPPNLLPFLDICVEVPQLGIIRSLNVHVTGALFIWEYAKQNNFS